MLGEAEELGAFCFAEEVVDYGGEAAFECGDGGVGEVDLVCTCVLWATKNEGVVGDGEDYEIDFGGDDNDDCDDDDGGDKTAPVDSSQDSLLGGATSFTDSLRADEAVRVFPKTGSVLVFQQRNLMHSGDDVFRGVKYTMRSDVMYTMDGGESE